MIQNHKNSIRLRVFLSGNSGSLELSHTELEYKKEIHPFNFAKYPTKDRLLTMFLAYKVGLESTPTSPFIVLLKSDEEAYRTHDIIRKGGWSDAFEHPRFSSSEIASKIFSLEEDDLVVKPSHEYSATTIQIVDTDGSECPLKTVKALLKRQRTQLSTTKRAPRKKKRGKQSAPEGVFELIDEAFSQDYRLIEEAIKSSNNIREGTGFNQHLHDFLQGLSTQQDTQMFLMSMINRDHWNDHEKFREYHAKIRAISSDRKRGNVTKRLHIISGAEHWSTESGQIVGTTEIFFFSAIMLEEFLSGINSRLFLSKGESDPDSNRQMATHGVYLLDAGAFSAANGYYKVLISNIFFDPRSGVAHSPDTLEICDINNSETVRVLYYFLRRNFFTAWHAPVTTTFSLPHIALDIGADDLLNGVQEIVAEAPRNYSKLSRIFKNGGEDICNLLEVLRHPFPEAGSRSVAEAKLVELLEDLQLTK